MLKTIATILLGLAAMAGPALAETSNGAAPAKCEVAEVNPVTGYRQLHQAARRSGRSSAGRGRRAVQSRSGAGAVDLGPELHRARAEGHVRREA